MCARRVMNVCDVLGVWCREDLCYFDVVYRCGVEREIVQRVLSCLQSSYYYLVFL